MKNLFEYLIDSNIKLEIDVDRLNNDKIVLLHNNEEFNETAWKDLENDINDIERKYSHFICTRFKSLGTSKSIKGGYDPNNDIYDINEYDLEKIIDKVITGRDAGYEVRLSGGHIEVDCINSGSRSTYYIYSLEQETYDKLSAWWEGDESVENLKFLYKENAIIPIEIK